MKTRLLIALVVVGCQPLMFAQATSSLDPEKCQIKPTQLGTLLALPFLKFDQDEAGGWRELADQGCKLEAALLIDAYLADAPPELSEMEKGNLYFHAGQLFAMSGQNRLAVSHMLHSLNPQEPIDGDLAWNDYVLASVAFLSRNRQQLQNERNQLAAAKQTRGNKINLGVVEGLANCFDKPYDVAYGVTCRPTLK